MGPPVIPSYNSGVFPLKEGNVTDYYNFHPHRVSARLTEADYRTVAEIGNELHPRPTLGHHKPSFTAVLRFLLAQWRAGQEGSR